MKNRSVPADIVLPHIVYENLPAAIEWLTRVFGFTEHYRYGDPVNGAQMHLGNAYIMVRNARNGEKSPASLGYGTQSLTIFVEDIEAQFQRVQAAGAKVVEAINVTAYGEQQLGVEDLEGHHWLFARHARDVDPAEWGAKVSER
jgi:uncharacterized glyoxalase superfamily protein PhnB